jgi:hypothetical protein
MNASCAPKRRGAVALGILTVLPLVLMVVAVVGFAVDWVHTLSDVPSPEDSIPAHPPGLGAAMRYFAVSGAAVLLSMGLLVFYTVDAARNPAVPGDRRGFWIAVLMSGHMLAFPAYWFLFWWRPSRAPSTVPLAEGAQ